MSLEEYKRKRDFKITNEPKGKNSKFKNQFRFVIQNHSARRKHFDLRLEWQGVLISFAIPKEIPLSKNQKCLAVKVEDHPLEYINFEGIIPKGQYGAGKVKIDDIGIYIALNDFSQGLKEGMLKFCLKGQKYNGNWKLVLMQENNWLIIKSSENEYHLPFDKVDCQLAQLSKKIPNGDDWIFETKFDGYRIIAFCENGNVKLKTRNNTDFSNKFVSICNSLRELSVNSSMVLDGEVVCFDELGRSDFGKLQQSIKSGKDNFIFIAFDILAYNGQDLKNIILKKRKEILCEILKNKFSNILISSFVLGYGEKAFSLAKKHKLEGIIAKNINSLYTGKRNGDWLKIKCYNRQEFVIGGYLLSEKNIDLSSILVGYYQNGKLIFIGKVGTGFKDNQKKELRNCFDKLLSKENPFFNYENKQAIWIIPKIVAEIQFAEITKQMVLRQPSFQGLRKDKDAKYVTLEV